MLSTVWNQHILKIVGLATKRERAKNEREQMSEELRAPPYIGEVGGDVLFIFHGGAGIYKNTTRGYKWISVGFVFTKMLLKATNGSQIL
jgi:hypothetical protein